MTFTLDRAGGAEVLKMISATEVAALAASVAAAAGPDASVITRTGKTRFVASIAVPAEQQAKDGVLSQAAAQLGLTINAYPKPNKTRTKDTRATTGKKRGRPRKNRTTS